MAQCLVLTAKKNNAICKVILETALLTDEEKIKACVICKKAGANFVKTSTGFSKGGATVGDIALMKYVVGSGIGVKASGGIRSKEDAQAMIASGADRIGASASVKIVSGEKSDGSY
jgi:deoxyribose-phosphate aldolase